MKNKFEVKQPGWQSRMSRYRSFLLRWGWFLLLSMILTTAYTYSLPDSTPTAPTSGHSTSSTTLSKARGTALFTSSFVTPDTFQATLQLQVQLPASLGLIADNLSTTLYSKVFLNPDTLNLALPKLQSASPDFKDLQLYTLQGMLSTTAVTGTRVLQLTATASSVDDAKLVVTTVYQAFVDNFHAERVNLINGLLKSLNSEYLVVQHDADTSKAEVDNLLVTGQGNTFLARSEANLNKQQQALATSISTQIQSLEQLKNNGSSEILQPYSTPRITTIPGSGSTRNLRLLLSPIIGLLMGLCGALLASGFSRKLPLRGKKRDQILPHILAFIPVLPGVNNERLRTQALRETASESLALLRRLRYRAGEHEQRLRVITVTSPISSEGKSTVATSMAIAAAQSGLRTILVDANPDHPVLHTWLQLPNSSGILDAIRALSTGVIGASPILTTNIVKLGFIPIGTSSQQKSAGTAGEAVRIDGLQPFT